MTQRFPHAAYECVAPDSLVGYPASSGAAVICVGAGLMMLTCDRLIAAGVPVCCTVDVGGLSLERMAQTIDWAAHANGHRLVVVHAWHSQTAADQVAATYLCQLPHLTQGPGPGHAPVIFRLRGYADDRIAPVFPNCWELDDLIHQAMLYGLGRFEPEGSGVRGR